MSGHAMPKEQYDYIRKIADLCLEATNMTDVEAWDFGFRCWQMGFVRRKKAQWVSRRYKVLDSMLQGFFCSECGQKGSSQPNFCPNCGADMRGDDHE